MPSFKAFTLVLIVLVFALSSVDARRRGRGVRFKEHRVINKTLRPFGKFSSARATKKFDVQTTKWTRDLGAAGTAKESATIVNSLLFANVFSYDKNLTKANLTGAYSQYAYTKNGSSEAYLAIRPLDFRRVFGCFLIELKNTFNDTKDALVARNNTAVAADITIQYKPKGTRGSFERLPGFPGLRRLCGGRYVRVEEIPAGGTAPADSEYLTFLALENQKRIYLPDDSFFALRFRRH